MTSDPPSENNMATLLEQYKLYVEMADRHSARRAETSKFYLTVLAALLAAVPITDKSNVSPHIQVALFGGVGLLGMVLCAVWRINLHSYRQLSSGKFRVIEEMEKCLPCCPFTREWAVVEHGKRWRKYIPLTNIEKAVPYTFLALYLGLFIYSLMSLF